jgi:hypothetical protein
VSYEVFILVQESNEGVNGPQAAFWAIPALTSDTREQAIAEVEELAGTITKLLDIDVDRLDD